MTATLTAPKFFRYEDFTPESRAYVINTLETDILWNREAIRDIRIALKQDDISETERARLVRALNLNLEDISESQAYIENIRRSGDVAVSA